MAIDPLHAGSAHCNDELRQLVVAAFEQARDSGKVEWNSMTVAVLKNRLLQISNREFSTERYGAGSMAQLLASIPETVRFNHGPPAWVEYHVAQSAAGADSSAQLPVEDRRDTESQDTVTIVDWKRVRIRDDLWRAMLDYDSSVKAFGVTYIRAGAQD